MNKMFGLGRIKKFGWCVAALSLLPGQSGYCSSTNGASNQWLPASKLLDSARNEGKKHFAEMLALCQKQGYTVPEILTKFSGNSFAGCREGIYDITIALNMLRISRHSLCFTLRRLQNASYSAVVPAEEIGLIMSFFEEWVSYSQCACLRFRKVLNRLTVFLPELDEMLLMLKNLQDDEGSPLYPVASDDEGQQTSDGEDLQTSYDEGQRTSDDEDLQTSDDEDPQSSDDEDPQSVSAMSIEIANRIEEARTNIVWVLNTMVVLTSGSSL